MKQIFPLLFGLIFLLSACVKNNPDPVWIEINEWQLEANPNALEPAGELSENLSEAWVYINNEFVGIFELPCKIPVIYAGNQTIRIYPAILNNGISATKKIYPFVEYQEITAEFVANETITINPVTRYKASTKFWIEDFEDPGNKLEEDATSNAVLTTVLVAGSGIEQTPNLNGNNFGRIELTESLNKWIANSVDSDVLDLPQGQEVYLEIDYHNTNRITTGLLAVSPTGTINNPNIQMNPQDDATVEWKKIYIDMREIVSASSSGAYFLLSFQAYLDDDETAGEINIDNIKVLHF